LFEIVRRGEKKVISSRSKEKKNTSIKLILVGKGPTDSLRKGGHPRTVLERKGADKRGGRERKKRTARVTTTMERKPNLSSSRPETGT